jgi:hypothetical protein
VGIAGPGNLLLNKIRPGPKVRSAIPFSSKGEQRFLQNLLPILRWLLADIPLRYHYDNKFRAVTLDVPLNIVHDLELERLGGPVVFLKVLGEKNVKFFKAVANKLA